MVLQGIITDRHEIVKRLEKELGVRAEYLGAPGFIYQVGDYRILKDASVQVADSKADRKMLETLINDGMLQGSTHEGRKGKFEIEFSRPSSLTMVNIVNEISARGWLIGKAAGNRDSISVSPLLVKSIKNINPGTTAEFKDALYAGGGAKAMRGFVFTDTGVDFTCFPKCWADEETAYRTLIELLVRNAEKQKWVKSERVETENERYTFRSWLNAIGMRGSQYRKTRQILLEKLSGDGTYRTLEQKEVAMKNRRRSEEISHSDFVLL